MDLPYKIIFRIEIDTLFDDHGKLSLTKMEHLAMVCTNLQNAGFKVLIVTSGAIMLGTAKMGLAQPPVDLIAKQAIAAIGQADLMKYYQTFFDSFDQIVAQVLITRDVVNNHTRNRNARMTLNRLLERSIIPIINENDSVSTDDIILNDNYPLTLIVARLVKPNAIIIKSNEEYHYRLMVRNNPAIMDIMEEDLFRMANTLKAGNSIADEIGFDCYSQRKLSDESGVVQQQPLSPLTNGKHVIAAEMNHGFPVILTPSIQ
jgi:glutamate 5-kinase